MKVLSHLLRNIAIICLVSAQQSFAAEEPLRFGSVAMDTPAAMQVRLAPLTAYLSETLGRPVVLKLSPNMANAIQALVKDEVDFAYFTPVAYIRAHDAAQAKLIAKTVTENEATFQLMIAVRQNSSIKKISDLAGKRFAFGDKEALLQRAAVVEAGMPLEKLGEYRFVGHYDNIVRGIMNGDYDAGILKDTTAMKWTGNGIFILNSSPPLPPYNITASAKLDAKTAEKLKNAFIALSNANPKHRSVIQSLDTKYSGFAATNDSEYDVVRKLIRPFKPEE